MEGAIDGFEYLTRPPLTKSIALRLCRLHLDHEKPFNSGPAAADAATAEPDYINLAVLRKRLMSQPAGLSRFPNIIGYASTQRILELYGNPHTPLLPDSGKEG